MLGAFAIAILVGYWPGMPGVEPDVKWAIASVAMSMLFMVRVRWTHVHNLIVLLIAWALATIAWSPVPYASADALCKMGMAFALFCVGHETRDLRAFYIAASLGILLSVGLSALQMAGIVDGLPALFDGRPDGTFGNPNFFAEAAALLIVATASANVWVLTASLAPALVMAEERAAFVAVAVAAVLLSGRTMLLIALLAAVMLVLPEHRDFLDSASGAQRLTIWTDVLTHLRPFGWGVGSFETVASAQSSLSHVLLSHAHNELLETAFELGIPGAVLALVLVAMVVGRARHTERLVLVAFAVEAFFGFPVHEPATAFLGAVVAGHAAREWPVVCWRELVRAASLRPRQRSHIAYAQASADGLCGAAVSA